ncbi:TetR/AcrR family transcriptional regulator [Pseudonocardia acaciae]|uniref:TetR/AcrR family transcriptional regulator n=1 Tax=Pseudonocardia acaciae TaxID=551276 RepID=UPI00048CB05E|nr:TetR/AcrR family transcriptional regulator [Pseudonocardia acaciae]
MRPSSRTAILDAALRLAERGGIGSLTLDSAAREAGVSKGGLIYHFASKEQLMLAVVEHVCRGWEAALAEELGTAYEDAPPTARARAYARVAVTEKPRRADLTILVDGMHDEALLAPWRALIARWTDTPPPTTDPVDIDRLVARLAAEGLWFAEATDTTGLSAEVRAAVVARIERLAASGGGRA